MRAAVLIFAMLASAGVAVYVGTRATEEKEAAGFTAVELSRPPATVNLPHAEAWKEVRRTLDALGYRIIDFNSLGEQGVILLSDPRGVDGDALASSLVARRGSSVWALTVAFEPKGAASTVITVGARVRGSPMSAEHLGANLQAGAAEMDAFIDTLALWKR